MVLASSRSFGTLNATTEKPPPSAVPGLDGYVGLSDARQGQDCRDGRANADPNTGECATPHRAVIEHDDVSILERWQQRPAIAAHGATEMSGDDSMTVRRWLARKPGVSAVRPSRRRAKFRFRGRSTGRAASRDAHAVHTGHGSHTAAPAGECEADDH